MRIVLVGGGTGGHFYPLIAIAEAIRDRDREEGSSSDLYYFGPDPYNAAALESVGVTFARVPAGKNRRGYGRLLNFLDVFKTAYGIGSAFLKLLRLYPDAVMSKGGYTSVPVVIAAWLLRIPIVVHESDAVPGRANLLGARFARYIGVAHNDASQFFNQTKVAAIGMPIRKAFFERVPDPYATLGIPKDRPVILVVGGSSGAERINDFVLSALPRLLQEFTIVHQAGDANLTKVSNTASTLFTDREPLIHYFVFGHLDQEHIAAALQAASLVVSRAGSTSLFEIAENGKPAIVIPIPEEYSRDQRANAYAYARATGAVVLEEKNLSDDILVEEIERILKNPELVNQMSQSAKALTSNNAAYTLADTLRAIAKEHE